MCTPSQLQNLFTVLMPEQSSLQLFYDTISNVLININSCLCASGKNSDTSLEISDPDNPAREGHFNVWHSLTHVLDFWPFFFTS